MNFEEELASRVAAQRDQAREEIQVQQQRLEDMRQAYARLYQACMFAAEKLKASPFPSQPVFMKTPVVKKWDRNAPARNFGPGMGAKEIIGWENFTPSIGNGWSLEVPAIARGEITEDSYQISRPYIGYYLTENGQLIFNPRLGQHRNVLREVYESIEASAGIQWRVYSGYEYERLAIQGVGAECEVYTNRDNSEGYYETVLHKEIIDWLAQILR